MPINYDRVPKFRQVDEGWVKAFTDVYCEAFNDPNGPYGEQNTFESTIRDVWNPHVEYGRIALAFDNDSVVGLACVEPIELASDEEKEYAGRVFQHLEATSSIRRSDLPVWIKSNAAN